MPSVAPTFARVSSIAHWSTFFHPQDGLFRLPRTDGASIEHLDIDLRFIDHEHDDEPDVFRYAQTAQATADVYLPNVAVITLRGAEHVHDHEERMDALAEVLLAIKPIEVRWLNATNDPKEQLTFSTHMVHPAVIAAGEIWARVGGAKRLVLQGGFPCPNLSAPTPYSLTPAATPCPSPGPHKTSFGAAIHSLSTIPSLSLTKPKPVDETKAKERIERKRLAEYSLKPRFDWAMGTWGAENLEWRFDGRYTPACILASIEHFFNALNKSFPYASTKSDTPLPAMISFAPLPTSIIFSIRELIGKLDLQPELVTYLVDSVFFATTDETRQARLFEGIVPESDVAPRQTNRLKAEMLVLQIQGCSIVPLGQILGEVPSSPQRSDSMTDSVGSLTQADGFSSGDEVEAVTPDMMASVVMPSENGKAQREMSPASSVVI